MTNTKPLRMWAVIRDHNGRLLPNSVQATRRLAIGEAYWNCEAVEYKDMKKLGYKAVRVLVSLDK